MTLYVVAQECGDGYLVLTVEEGIPAFEGKHAAEDFSDQLDEEGEFIAIPYDPSMGPAVWVV